MTRRHLPALLASLTSAALLAGCFSMGPVPPGPDLEPVVESDVSLVATIDASASPVLESAWGREGTFVLVRPRLNGNDVGWFILDTGASGCTISESAARRAGLRPVGSARLQASTQTTVFLCDSLVAGPLILSDLHMSGLNMHSTGLAFGREVVGILGRELCASAVVQLDGPRRTVRLLQPEGFRLDGDILWHPIQLYRGLPVVRCSYLDDARGQFVVDTGANSAVVFTGDAVQRHDLTSHPSVVLGRSRTQVTFGAKERIRTGTLARFAVGDQEVGPVSASFGSPGDSPSTVLPEADGVIGMALLNRFVVYLDEPRRRVALVEPELAAWP